MMLHLTKGAMIGALQGATVAMLLYNYTNTGGLGTIGWLGCLTLLILSFILYVLKRKEEITRKLAKDFITTNLFLSYFLLEKGLRDEFFEFAKSKGLKCELVQPEAPDETE